ncbi:MAG: hypothetical protein Q9180_006982, partial [Flavoplaca navasiana]
LQDLTRQASFSDTGNGAAVNDAGSDGAQVPDPTDIPKTEAAIVQQGTPFAPESVPTAKRPSVEEPIPAMISEHHHKERHPPRQPLKPPFRYLNSYQDQRKKRLEAPVQARTRYPQLMLKP